MPDLRWALFAGLVVLQPRTLDAQSGESPTASAAVSAAPVTYFACYVPVIGTVYRIKQPGLPNQCFFGSHVQFSWTDGAGSGVTDHGALTGLADDDHPQYLLGNGTRALTGTLSLGGNRLTSLGAATTAGDAVRFEQAIKMGDAAGGDLAGTFPSPSLGKLLGSPLSTMPPNAAGQVLTWNGTAWTAQAPPDGVTDHGALTGLSDDDHPHYLLATGARPLTGNLSLGGYKLTDLAAASALGDAVRYEQAVKRNSRVGTLPVEISAARFRIRTSSNCKQHQSRPRRRRPARC